MPKHIIVSGAGIAGTALAHELAARGWRATVLERFPEHRSEGQNVDIRGAARAVIQKMGVEAAVRAANTTEVGIRFVRADGSTAAAFPVSRHGGADGPTAELEILRSELSRILFERSSEHADYRYGVSIADVADHGDRVTATLDDGSALDGDALVIAEGLRSRSRRFVTSAAVRDFSMYFAYATLPRRDSDEKWWLWQRATRSRAVHLRPDNVGTTRAILTFFSDARGFEDLDRESQVTILRRTFADVGGIAPRVLGDLEAGAPLYFSVVGQVRSPTWSKGRIALLGDTAFCNATFGGAGTSLALIGAYVLAGELAGAERISTAFAQYERVMKPFAGAAPKVSERALRLANPRSRNGVRALDAALGLAANPIVKKVSALASRAMTNTGEELLPAYPDAPHRARLG
ncbi:FAD dependent oxidoreductase [Segniliparus rotundus DSM 44985]|uniref:FAD dependent oxidoreductase n=1 Tax=Segniliparus rotundus (strain ATCC BAA-972 / CDC 1076 / CIP 108378 / DSM 44985 / JCM 13578) TaxID=640132 RepID=D6ZD41_SEGRD|nr:FAD-dependent monooxygenase [Segniliparus rotundus]ADG99228.1 FAD dependent oxidoreductase [Segniliparus rotundus DSM 44985]